MKKFVLSPTSITVNQNKTKVDQTHRYQNKNNFMDDKIGETLENIGVGKNSLNRTPISQ